MIRDLEDKPKDSSYDEEIKDLSVKNQHCLQFFRKLVRRISLISCLMRDCFRTTLFQKQVLFCVAVLYRKEDEETPVQKKKYEKMVYEYSRSASSAISEFAPNNSFYVDGRKLTIDQVDLTTAQTARWRLA